MQTEKTRQSSAVRLVLAARDRACLRSLRASPVLAAAASSCCSQLQIHSHHHSRITHIHPWRQTGFRKNGSRDHKKEVAALIQDALCNHRLSLQVELIADGVMMEHVELLGMVTPGAALQQHSLHGAAMEKY